MEPKRFYSEDLVIDSDTFKLEPENYAKNLSFDNSKPIYIGVEHCHFFHTYDSNGRKMDKCNHVGGHTHSIKVTVDKNGNMKGECGVAEHSKAVDNKDDRHTHKITYIKSDKIKLRQINPKAQQFIANFDKI